MRQISHIQIDDCWRLIQWNLISTSLQLIFVVEQVNNWPCISLILWRISWIEVIHEVIFRPNFSDSSRIGCEKIPCVSSFIFSLLLLYLFRCWSLDLKYKHCVWMRIYVSNYMIDVIYHLSKDWMSSVIHISDVYYFRFHNCHTSFEHIVYNLHLSIFLLKVE